MSESNIVVGLIAGGRQFPLLVAKGVKEHGHKLVVAGFTGHTNMAVVDHADVWRELKLGKLNELIQFFKENGVNKVIMAGTIDKPKIMDIRHLDMRAIKLVFKRKNKGDSAILGALASEFEAEGMFVAQAHELVPELLSPVGTITRCEPTEQQWEDIRFGWKLAKEFGRLDVGQCVVVREGIVAAIEALEGTDEAIRRGCAYGGEQCVVVKVFKPGQDERIDLPSLGLDTIQIMIEGGATCLAYEAGKSLFFDQEKSIEIANKAGLSIVGVLSEDI